jgi:hypothetical protein
MWGGVFGAIPDMRGRVMGWRKKDSYGADLDFLGQAIWPQVANDQVRECRQQLLWQSVFL